MELAVVNGGVHTGRRQHQRICTQNGVLASSVGWACWTSRSAFCPVSRYFHTGREDEFHTQHAASCTLRVCARNNGSLHLNGSFHTKTQPCESTFHARRHGPGISDTLGYRKFGFGVPNPQFGLKISSVRF